MKQRDSLIDRLTGGATTPDGDPRAAQFVRGLALGALVGAAIAGSAIWQRRQSRSVESKVDHPETGREATVNGTGSDGG